MCRYMCVRYMRLLGIRRTADRLDPPRDPATFVALSYFRFYYTPLGGYSATRIRCVRNVSALHSLTYIYVMHNEKVIDEEILFVKAT